MKIAFHIFPYNLNRFTHGFKHTEKERKFTKMENGKWKMPRVYEFSLSIFSGCYCLEVWLMFEGNINDVKIHTASVTAAI